jgi:hypothetical protein
MLSRTLAASTVATFGLLSLTALASAETTSKTTELKPFTELTLKGCFEAKLAPGAKPAITIEATPKQQGMLAVEQSGHEVTVKETDDDLCDDGPVKVTVTASFPADAKVELSLRGSGTIDADVGTAKGLELSLAGSGDAVAKGKVQSCELEVAGSGSIDASALGCDLADTEIKGSGDVKLGTVKDLAVEIKGSGDVSYKGEPKMSKVDIKGSGSIKKL